MAGRSAAGIVLSLLAMIAPSMTTAAPETWTVKHALGETEVPRNPQRIATLQDHTLLLPLLELGVRPVASAGRYTRDGKPHFRGTDGYDTSGIEFLGPFLEPSFEALVAVAPDLIIAAPVHAPHYELLSAIAPTVVVPAYQVPVTESSKILARLVGRMDRYRELHDRYQRRVEALRKALGNPASLSAIHLQLGGDGLQVFKQSPIDDVLNDVGFARPASWHEIGRDELTVAIEALPRFDADIIIDTYEPLYDTREATARYRDTALWQGLFAVRHDQFIYAHRSRWMGLAFANLFNVLDGLEKHLLGREIASRRHRSDGPT
jgi:iron complex transport system substrate-binding protein